MVNFDTTWALAAWYTQAEVDAYIKSISIPNKEPGKETILPTIPVGTWGAIIPEAPKASTTNWISDNQTALLTNVWRWLMLAGKKSPEILKLIKSIPAAKLAGIAWKYAAKWAGAIVNWLIAAWETYLDAKSWKLAQNWNYIQNAWNAFASYLDSALFNAPELITKAAWVTPFWENNQDKRFAIEQNNQNLENGAPSRDALIKSYWWEKFFNKMTMTQQQAFAKVVGEQVSKNRKTNPKYTANDFYKQYTYNPKTNSFQLNK